MMRDQFLVVAEALREQIPAVRLSALVLISKLLLAKKAIIVPLRTDIFAAATVPVTRCAVFRMDI